MARIITKQHALAIVEKLKASLATNKKNRPHDLYRVYENDELIANFSIRRGSEKDKGHDHVPKQLLVSPRDARDLAQCPMSREDWIEKLKTKKQI